jgi:tetratricopeptide (TPR) repeat protein
VLVLLQWLFVNLHSYFMLGLGVTGAILIDRLLNRNKADLLIMIKLLAAQTAVCLINPWGWRLAVLPLQTLSYIHTQGIRAGAGEHPWSNILELKPTYHSGFPMSVSHWALLLLWVMTIAAVGFAIKQRRWAMIIIMTAMVFVSLSMRRNIAAAAIVLVPIVLANLKYFRLNPAASIGGALIAITLSIALATSISSNQFYHFNGQPSRFGMGLSRAYLPIDAARWLDKHMPYARVWCDMSSSSTIHFFTRPHREVPILSNTWAYPPAVMAEELAYRATQKPFAQCVNKYGIDAVVLRADWSRPLFLSLLRDTRWVLVHVQSVHVVLVRIDGQYAKLSAQAISNKPVDQNAYIQKLGSVDPFADMSLLPAAQIFTDAKLHDLAIQLCELSTVREPRLLRAWNQLGYALTMRGHNSLKQGNHSGLDDIDQAVLCHEKALTIDPDNIFAHRQLEQLAGIITATR